MRDLRRPLRDGRRGALKSIGRHRDSRQALSLIMAHGDKKTKALAEALTRRLIHDTMVARLHDRRHGSLPYFAGRLRKAVGSFKDRIR